MKKKLAKIVLAILFIFPVYAQAVTFTSDANIQAGDYWMGVDIYDTPPNHTTVTMTGGTVNDSMVVYNASTLNMSGGNVFGLGAVENSTVNISGGYVAGLTLHDNATLTISQNASIGSAAAMEASIINMNGGTIASSLRVGDNSILNMNDGIISHLGVIEYSTLNLMGGNITNSLGADSLSATINIFGYDLTKTASGGGLGYGQVSGFWQNGTSFAIDLGSSETYSVINLIPEPTTLLLLGVGAFLLRKSHK
jgi:hypothetical protein